MLEQTMKMINLCCLNFYVGYARTCIWFFFPRKIVIELEQLFWKNNPSRTLGVNKVSQFWMLITQLVLILALLIVAYLYKCIVLRSCHGILKYVIVGKLFYFVLITIYWASNINVLNFPMVLIKVNFIPRIIYIVVV